MGKNQKTHQTSSSSSSSSSSVAENIEPAESPVEQVRHTVPTTDDPTIPVLTFRTWVLGFSACLIIYPTFSFSIFRQNPLYFSSTLTQIIMLPLGRLMASSLPKRIVRIPWLGFSFSLNPGPFSIKEHLLANTIAWGGYPSSLLIITSKRVFFSQDLNILPSFMMIMSTQLLGYGFAGWLTKLLVHSPYMWWPVSLIDVTMYRAMHDTDEDKMKGKSSSKFQFLIIAGISSFAYYIIPNFFFPSITALSCICWIWKSSITAQQIGSGVHGLGLGSFALDWSTISGYLGSPMAFPLFTIINTIAGIVLILYIIVPIAYWSNLFEARRFPIFSIDVFDYDGKVYNVSRVLNPETNQLDLEAYNNYSKLYQSISFVFKSGFEFAALVASIIHVALFDGRSVWQQFIQAYKNEGAAGDVHNHLMRKYKTIPSWWYYSIIVISLGLGFAICEGFGKEFQLPFWGILLACALVLVFLPPLGVILATSSKIPSTAAFAELIISYLYPGKPFANMTFNIYSSMSINTAFGFLYQLKLGHYMKIPPRHMFIAQISATVISSSISFFCNWWIISSVKNICQPDKLPKGSQWTCLSDRVSYNKAISWGVIGPQRLYYPDGLYGSMYYFFLIGLMMPIIVWLLSRAFPAKRWIRSINFPVLFSASASILPATAVNFWSWCASGVFFHVVVLRRFGNEWIDKGYLLSAALDAGSIIAGFVISASLQLPAGVYGLSWWGLDLDDHCPLASCPTVPGVNVPGCPTI